MSTAGHDLKPRGAVFSVSDISLKCLPSTRGSVANTSCIECSTGLSLGYPGDVCVVLGVWDNCALAVMGLQVWEEAMAAPEPSVRLVCGSVCPEVAPGWHLLATALPAEKDNATQKALSLV